MSSSNGFATREQLLSYVRSYKDIPLPSGAKVRIQSFSNREHEDLQLRTMNVSGEMDIRGAYEGFAALMVARAVVDGDGNRIFGDHDCGLIQDSMDPETVAFLRDEITDHTNFGKSAIESQKKSSADSQDSSSPTN